MIELKTMIYITSDDVEKLTGKHWSDFEFAQTAENDSYQVLCCTDWDLEELYEKLKWESSKEGIDWEDQNCRAVRLKNQIELIEILRKDYGIRGSVLIWISW